MKTKLTLECVLLIEYKILLCVMLLNISESEVAPSMKRYGLKIAAIPIELYRKRIR